MKCKAVAGLFLALAVVSADHAGEKKENGKGLFPGFPGIVADLAILEVPGVFKIAKIGVDINQKVPIAWWVLEVQTEDPLDREEVRKAWGVPVYEYYDKGPRILLKDADRVTISEGQLLLQGFHDRLRKGDGVRVIMELPPPAIMDRTRFVTFTN
jgi:hypothetical protein